jgi:hypothetical protein
MTYVKFMFLIAAVFKKNNRRHYFRSNPHIWYFIGRTEENQLSLELGSVHIQNYKCSAEFWLLICA